VALAQGEIKGVGMVEVNFRGSKGHRGSRASSRRDMGPYSLPTCSISGCFSVIGHCSPLTLLIPSSHTHKLWSLLCFVVLTPFLLTSSKPRRRHLFYTVSTADLAVFSALFLPRSLASRPAPKRKTRTVVTTSQTRFVCKSLHTEASAALIK